MLKVGVLVSTLALSVCQAGQISIASFEDWTNADADRKVAYLNDALKQMREKNTADKHYRLVIMEDVPGGKFFCGTKGEVYLSDSSGETSTSYYSAYFTSNTAYHHNLLTHKALLELYKNILTKKEVEEKATNDSLDLLLPLVYNDVQSSLQDLLGKDVKAEQLQSIIKHVSVPHVLYIQEKPVPSQTTAVELPETKVSSGKKEPRKIKNPVINGSKVMKLVQAGNERDEKARKESETLKAKKK